MIIEQQTGPHFEDKNSDEISPEELQILVNQYKVGDPSKINKKDGKIYHGDEDIEVWFKRMEDLYGQDDNEPYWNK